MAMQALPEPRPASLEVIEDRVHHLMEGVTVTWAEADATGPGAWENVGSPHWEQMERLIEQAVYLGLHGDCDELINDIVDPIHQSVIAEVIRRVHESGRARS